MYSNGQSLLEQKRLQWAREREEMVGLCGLWGTLDKAPKEKPVASEFRRNSLLPPILPKSDDFRSEESETSGYISDSPQHDCESSDSQQWSAGVRRDNYWGDRKTQKNIRNESQARGTPDSLLSTPEDRLKWGDRGVGVGHLWEPVVEMPDSRLPQVFESYRATPRWVERGLKLSDGNKADILFIQHEEDEKPPTKFLLGQNAPLPPEVLEERERKRLKAMEHQNAIRKQLEEREKKRKEEKEIRLREERLEEERILREQEQERQRREEDQRKSREKENIERRKEQVMREAIEAAEEKAKDERRKLKKQETDDLVVMTEMRAKPKEPTHIVPLTEPPREATPKTVKDSFCQSESEPRQLTDSSSQSDDISGLGFMNMGVDGGLALVLDGVQDAVQLALLMPQLTHCASAVPRLINPPLLQGMRLLADAATQTSRKCCSVVVDSETASSRKCCSVASNSVRSRRSQRQSSRTSGRSDSSEKSTSLERRPAHSHSHCTSSAKHRSRSQPRLSMGDRPKWGINRPAVQYLKQSEKDPHYMRRLKRRGRRTKEAGTCTNIPMREKLLESEYRLLAFQTDEEVEKKEDSFFKPKERPNFEKEEKVRDILEHGFRMVSNPSSPRFVPISEPSLCEKEVDEMYELLVTEEKTGGEEDDESCLVSQENVVFSNNIQNIYTCETKLQEPLICEDLSNSFSFSDIDDSAYKTQDSESRSDAGTEEKNESTNTGDPENSGKEESSDMSGENELPANRKWDIVSPPSSASANTTSPRSCELVEETSSPPTSSRSDPKSNDADVDADDDSDDEDNRSVVSGSIRSLSNNHRDTINQIAALKMGLERLKMDAESRCSTPLSLLSLPEETS